MGLSSVAASTGERYPPLRMRTLGQSLLVAVLLAVGMSTLAAQTDIEALRAKAEQGDASAQFNLGNGYNNGEGVPQDYGVGSLPPANAGRSVVLTTARMAGTT